MLSRESFRPILLGHRGARKYAPENSTPAFSLALEHGCDGFEFDVRLTKDRCPILCHDPKLDGLEVARTTTEQLHQQMYRKGHVLEKFEDVIKRFGRQAYLNVELKVPDAERCVVDILSKNVAKENCLISSFLPDVIKQLHDLKCEYPLGLICENQSQLAVVGSLPLNALMLERKLAHPNLIEVTHSLGRQVFVWTVNQASEMLKLTDMGVDGLISDDTALLAQTLGTRRNSLSDGR